jgi:hypothetical protein
LTQISSPLGDHEFLLSGFLASSRKKVVLRLAFMVCRYRRKGSEIVEPTSNVTTIIHVTGCSLRPSLIPSFDAMFISLLAIKVPYVFFPRPHHPRHPRELRF